MVREHVTKRDRNLTVEGNALVMITKKMLSSDASSMPVVIAIEILETLATGLKVDVMELRELLKDTTALLIKLYPELSDEKKVITINILDRCGVSTERFKGTK